MLIFLSSFILYLLTLFPGVAPYRDSGEMVSAAKTLGIIHPPGYPLYALLSKIFLMILPFGNAGYRLNVLSALAGAGTVWFLYKALLVSLSPGEPTGAERRNWLDFLTPLRVSIFMLSLLFASSYLQWYLSLVSEMYTLNTFLAALLLYLPMLLAKNAEKGGYSTTVALAAAFVFGLGLGNRMDLLLLGGIFLWVGFAFRKYYPSRGVAGLFIAFLAGFSIYLYLPVRSSLGPLLDWNHPASLARLWGTLTRQTHGGTLDLISASYIPGENFISTLEFYLAHVWSGFAYIGLPLGILGIYFWWNRAKSIACGLLLGWLFTGPLFIYIANIPPNPHALVILEAHFLLPNLIAMFFIAGGFAFLFYRSQEKRVRIALAGAAIIAAGFNIGQHFQQLDKRANFVAYDYAKNIVRSAPPHSLLVMKKDVQLFALWNRQFVEGDRPDLAVISQGLAASPWYQRTFGYRHPDVVLGPLRTQEDWQNLLRGNPGKNVYFSSDADYSRPAGYQEEALGLINKITVETGISRAGVLLNYIYPYRGEYLYSAYREFFTPDLIEDYAKSYVQLGQYHLQKNEFEKARNSYRNALAMKPFLPYATNFMAYSYFVEGKYRQAEEYYHRAIGQYEELKNMAIAFNSLPAVKEGIGKDLSDAFLSLGVCYERLNDDARSLDSYQKALEANPSQARAYFNRAVIFWKRNEWARVVDELENALRVDPRYQEAAFYLPRAREKMQSVR